MKKKIMLILLCIAFLSFQRAYAAIEGDPEKIPGWVLVYEHDASGTAVSGDIDDLIAAVKSAADIKVSKTDDSAFFNCAVTRVDTYSSTDYVSCTVLAAYLIESINPVVIETPPYLTYVYYDTLGSYGLA